MKVVVIAYIISCFVLLNSCNTKTKQEKDELFKTDNLALTEQEQLGKGEVYVVYAKSGLNYRDKPDGKVIGNFPDETEINVIEKTGITQTIVDKDNSIAGEWLGVNHNGKKVYVFSGFVYKQKTEPEISIYTANPVFDDGGYFPANINVSETYFFNINKNNPLLTTENLKSDQRIYFTPVQRKKFLETVNISENDKAFVYDALSQKLHTYSIKDLKLYAQVNAYMDSNDRDDFTFDYCFDLEKNYTGSYDNFVFIGQENPFVAGGLKAMDWKLVRSENIPEKVKESFMKSKTNNEYTSGNSYEFKDNHLIYFVHNLESVEYIGEKLLVVWDSNKKEITQTKKFFSHEDHALKFFPQEGETPADEKQYIGKLFKDKPEVVYGFYYHNFGCPEIEFLSGKQLPIPILCDNRH